MRDCLNHVILSEPLMYADLRDCADFFSITIPEKKIGKFTHRYVCTDAG